MRNIYKKILDVLLLIMCFLAFLSTDVKAIEKESYYKYYDTVSNFDIGNLTFANARLYTRDNYSGIKATLINNSDTNITLSTRTYYYDANLRTIGRSSSKVSKIIEPGTTEYIERMSIDSGYNFEDIKYFTIKATTSESEDVKVFDKNITVEPIYKAPEISYSYKINDYDVAIKVNEDNVLDITEKLTVDFLEGKHGIIRQIPVKNSIIRANGETSNLNAQVLGVTVNEEHVISVENGQYFIKIGNADKVLDGKKQYIIKYRYNLGRDKIKDRDELYFNIIGSEWDTIIENINFTVDMPKNFDKKKIEFYSGPTGSYKNTGVKYSVKDNQIKGTFNKVLNPNNAITIRLDLEDGYFKNAGYKINFVQLISIFISLLFLGITVLIWQKNCHSFVETVEFYPPDNLNSLELAFAYKGKANAEDLLSLLVYLVHKMYIKIEKIKDKPYEDYKIIKEKEYDKENIYEKMLMSEIFKKRDEIIVSKTDLSKSFEKILKVVNSQENKDKIILRKDKTTRVFIWFLMFAVYLLISLPPIIKYSDIQILTIPLLFVVFLPGMIPHIIIDSIVKDWDETKKSVFYLIFLGVILLLFTMVTLSMWYSAMITSLESDPFNIVICIIGFISILGMEIFKNMITIRTEYGNKMYGRIRGFRNFLLTVEKEKLESLVSLDPEYFYNILPYTYVLNISDKWIEKFETLIYEPSSLTDNGFNDVKMFKETTDSLISAVSFFNTNHSSSGSSYGSGSSGSSGSSGGGAGGGGGSSW